MPICPRGHESQAEDWCDFCGFPMTPGAGAGVPAGGAYGTPPPPPGPPPMPPQMPHQSMPGATEGLVTCPICRTPQTGRYCEECGYDYELATPMAPAQQQQVAYGYPPPAQVPQGGGYGYPPPAAPEPVPAQNGYPQQAPNGGAEYGTSFHLAPPSQPVRPEPPAPVRNTWLAVVSADRDYFTDMMARSGPEASGLFFPPYCPERRIPLTGRGQLRIGRRSQHRGTVPEIDLSVPPEDPGASHQHALLAEQPDGSWVLVDQDSTNGTTVNGGSEPIAPHTAIPLNDGDRIHIGAWTTITLHRA